MSLTFAFLIPQTLKQPTYILAYPDVPVLSSSWLLDGASCGFLHVMDSISSSKLNRTHHSRFSPVQPPATMAVTCSLPKSPTRAIYFPRSICLCSSFMATFPDTCDGNTRQMSAGLNGELSLSRRPQLPTGPQKRPRGFHERRGLWLRPLPLASHQRITSRLLFTPSISLFFFVFTFYNFSLVFLPHVSKNIAEGNNHQFTK